MIRRHAYQRRRGSIMPVMALLLVAMCGFTALSVEIATIASVKLACQAAADAGALAGARTLDGSTTPKTSQSVTNAQAAAAGNSALGYNAAGKLGQLPFAASEVAVTNGTYHYNTSTQTFGPAYSLQSGETYNLVQVVASRAVKNSFFSVDAGSTNAPGVNQTLTATAVATHRPRDISVIFDFSGSMNDESDLWNCDSYYGSYYNLSNNSDPLVPAFGHYSSSAAALVSTSSAPGGQCNMTVPIQGMPAEVASFVSSGPSVAPTTSAFNPAAASYGAQPMGDVPLYSSLSTSGGYAQTPNQLFGSNNGNTITVAPTSPITYNVLWNPDYFENGDAPPAGSGVSQGSNNAASAGYDLLYQYLISSYNFPASPSGRNLAGAAGFSGYTQGPAYWGKTFFLWPPDPRPTKDWRQLYFIDISGNKTVDNNELWVSSPQSPYGNYWKFPYETWSGVKNYRINYKAILAWIKSGPNPFPSQLRAGRTSYYSYIPTDVPAAAYDPTQPNSNITDPSQRFWKEYIDYTLGCWIDPFGNVWPPGYPACSLGPDYAWGTVQVSARPSGSVGSGQKLAYMNYNDNPARPRHRMWFGPMTMLQYISDTGLNPGTARDISTYSTKLGITSVLQDIQVNHPNDSVAMILYNRPQYSGEPSIGEFSQAQYNLNRNYSAMINSLWYPPNSSGTTDVTPWDTNGNQTPAADNDFINNTATQHGLMLAYNQFSGSSTLQSAGVGGLGRVGAQRLVILETDGMANVNTNAGFTSSGNNSYYDVLPSQAITAGNYDQNALLQVAQSICNTPAGVAGTANSAVSNPGHPGFASTSRPVIIHTIAFGIVFQVATSTQTSAVGLLQAISQIGGTTFPSSASDPTNGYKWCIGTLSNRITLLQQAFAKVLDDGQAISLIQ